MSADELQAERDEAREQMAALEANGAELLTRAERAEAEAAEAKKVLAEANRVQGHLRAAYEAHQHTHQQLADELYASCICDPNPETTEGMLEDCPVHGAKEHRPLALRQRAIAAEDERDQLRARLTGVAIHVQRLKTWAGDERASVTVAGSIITDLLAAVGGKSLAEAAEVVAERNAFKAGVAEVRRLCELTIAASCRMQAIDQAVDTLAVLDRTLPAPESTGSES